MSEVKLKWHGQEVWRIRTHSGYESFAVVRLNDDGVIHVVEETSQGEQLGCYISSFKVNSKLHAAIEAKDAEIEELKSSKKFSDEFNAVRWKRLSDLFRGTQYEKEFFSIMANGTASALENPTYAQIVNIKEYEIEQLQTDNAALKQNIKELERLNEIQRESIWQVIFGEPELMNKVIYSEHVKTLQAANTQLELKVKELQFEFFQSQESVKHFEDSRQKWIEKCEKLRVENVEREQKVKELRDALAAYIKTENELEQKVKDLEKSELELIDERDHREDQINEIADLLGDHREWSSHNDRGDNCLESIGQLQTANSILEAKLKKAVEQRDVYCEDAYSDQEQINCYIYDDNKELAAITAESIKGEK